MTYKVELTKEEVIFLESMLFNVIKSNDRDYIRANTALLSVYNKILERLAYLEYGIV